MKNVHVCAYLCTLIHHQPLSCEALHEASLRLNTLHMLTHAIEQFYGIYLPQWSIYHLKLSTR
jgi:hypothetical protein